MSVPDPERSSEKAGERWFATTHWSVVLTARDRTSAFNAEALEKLCRTYWYPIYAHLRRRGYSAHDAQDLTQEFFAQHLARNFLGHVDQAKGKFRTFLLVSINHFLSHEWHRAKAAKRGGREMFVSLDDDAVEKRYLRDAITDLSPDRIFEQRWAWAVFDQALAKLREEYSANRKGLEFGLLKCFLADYERPGAYAAAGAELQMTPGTVAVAVHRMRHRYRDCVREEIRQTVLDPADIEDELRHLLDLVRG